jgi:hypothetical protein
MIIVGTEIFGIRTIEDNNTREARNMRDAADFNASDGRTDLIVRLERVYAAIA